MIIKSGVVLLAALLFTFAASAQLNDESHNPNSQITGGPNHSSTSKKPGKAQESGLDGADQQFIKEAAQGGQAEVDLGNLAQQHASDPAVKEFGKRMVGDHTKANEDLQLLAKSKGVQLPTTLNSSNHALKEKLSQLSGQQFDTQYMEAMIADHKHDVAEFNKAANDAYDPDVKKFAGKYLPILINHLKQAQDISHNLHAQGNGQTNAK